MSQEKNKKECQDENLEIGVAANKKTGKISADIAAKGKIAVISAAVIVIVASAGILASFCMITISNHQSDMDSDSGLITEQIEDEDIGEKEISSTSQTLTNEYDIDENKNDDFFTLEQYRTFYNQHCDDIEQKICSVPEQLRTEDAKNLLASASKKEAQSNLTRSDQEEIIDDRKKSYDSQLNTGSREVSILLANDCIDMIKGGYEGVDINYYLLESKDYYWEALSYDNTSYNASSNSDLLYEFGNMSIFAAEYETEEKISLHTYITAISCLDMASRYHDNTKGENNKNEDDINFLKLDVLGKMAEKYDYLLSADLKQVLYNEYEITFQKIHPSFKEYSKALYYYNNFTRKYGKWNDEEQ